jgi:putative ABC transport system permease protein
MEHLCTYRDSLIESEEIVEGAFQAQADPKKDSVLVSITETIAEQLQLHVGDEVVFNLHGIAVPAYIGSVRKVDWQRIQTNFAFVFPIGVLEKAPQFYATLLHSPSKETTAKLKQELILRYSNVSTVDLTLVLKTIDDLIDRIAFAIHFMAFFSILTGLMVLAGSVVNSRFAKIRENTLLRTLGAARWQISLVGILEYAYIGFLAAATGVGLSLFAIEWLTQYFLEISFDHDWGNLAGVVGVITGLTVLVSWLNLRTLLNRPPLEVLREENG